VNKWGKRPDGSAPRAVHRTKAHHRPFIFLRISFLSIYSSFSLHSSIHLPTGVLKIQVLVLLIHIQIQTHINTQHSLQCESLKSSVVDLGSFEAYNKPITETESVPFR